MLSRKAQRIPDKFQEGSYQRSGGRTVNTGKTYKPTPHSSHSTPSKQPLLVPEPPSVPLRHYSEENDLGETNYSMYLDATLPTDEEVRAAYGNSQNMQQWLPKRSAYLECLLRTEGNEKWTGQFFQDAGLWEVGVQLSVGHMGGNCPSQGVLLEACWVLETQKDKEDNLGTENPPLQWPELQPHQSNLVDSDSTNIDYDPEDPEWQDIPMLQTNPVLLRTPTPTMDDLEIQHILIVDASGLISLPAIWCVCLEKAEKAGSRPDDAEKVGKPDEHLLDFQMLAASYEKIKTVFSFHCLDDYWLSNLECKTLAYQYYQKLQRLTNPAFPHLVPNQYNEFCWAT
ncbi:hypothetical protein BYT27DRAFT_7216294 [Phlegmacium glaucopus]|nr:hypothetical protein BYT27DRAFT_7216294 [Phlegmacium glaucopus]